jgi:hypothetical protein
MLIYGISGAGKTTLAGSSDSVSEMRPVLFIDVEGGTLSLRNMFPNVEKVRIGSWQAFDSLYEELKTGKHEFKTIVVDSLTEVQKLSMEFTMDTRKGNDPMAIPEIKEWGINTEHVRKFVRKFRDLPMNVIMTALVRVDVDKRTTMTTKKPSLTGKAADEVSAFFDIVAHLYIETVEEKNERILLTDSIPGVIAKDRTNLLDKQILNPTMQYIFKQIQEGEKLTNDLQA